ncbi:mycothione reductase [Kocuria tytonis]|uniref:Mycothione reductase n=1 Tax=Kocuria tytonis TaxID=2054280 RepID=A0A495A9M4_9MICC|nr:mycothione reductase [Kocuria tytonis]RKQ36150.1 mycothione reductase [Kocuria tytonis]
MRSYDLIIVGSGSGNSILTDEYRDMDVAIVEPNRFGGTCLNVGCIPTKMYVYPATVADQARDAARLGVDAAIENVDWPGMRDRIFARIDAIATNGLQYRQSLENVTVIQEYVHFVAPYVLETQSGERITAPQIVLANGSRVHMPDVPGTDLEGVHTSDTVMRLPQQPRDIVVVGGGYIAAEFCHVFQGLGSSVTQLNRSHRLLRAHDDTIAERFAREAAEHWDLQLGWSITGIERAQDGRLTVRAEASDGSGELWERTADVVLLATGRVPNADTLDPGAADLDVTDAGLLAVDEHQRVLSGGEPVAGLWALGDVCSPHQLKHVANAEARVVSHNVVHPEDLRGCDHRYVPSAVFTEPQIASVGMTERAAREWAAENGAEITVKEQDFGDVAYGWAMEDRVGICKLIADSRTGELLGAHLIGRDASNLVQPLVQGMSFGLRVHEMARGQYWIHPALAEVVENALLGLDVPGQRPDDA